jgi:hypothetical protein
VRVESYRSYSDRDRDLTRHHIAVKESQDTVSNESEAIPNGEHAVAPLDELPVEFRAKTTTNATQQVCSRGKHIQRTFK